MNVLGNTANPSTSIDICHSDGFMLDSGLRISEGDGVILTGSEAFVWRPWMGRSEGGEGGVVHGEQIKKTGGKTVGTGGVVNNMGQFELGEDALGVFGCLWPRPGMFDIIPAYPRP